MTTARDVMNRGVQIIGSDETLLDAAKHMKNLQIGSLPIQDPSGEFIGMVTDRDIVIRCIADGADAASTPASALATGNLVTVAADTDIDEVLAVMREHQVKRMPVIDDGTVIGMISESDLVAELSSERIAHFAEGVYKKH